MTEYLKMIFDVCIYISIIVLIFEYVRKNITLYSRKFTNFVLISAQVISILAILIVALQNKLQQIFTISFGFMGIAVSLYQLFREYFRRDHNDNEDDERKTNQPKFIAFLILMIMGSWITSLSSTINEINISTNKLPPPPPSIFDLIGFYSGTVKTAQMGELYVTFQIADIGNVSDSTKFYYKLSGAAADKWRYEIGDGLINFKHQNIAFMNSLCIFFKDTSKNTIIIQSPDSNENPYWNLTKK